MTLFIRQLLDIKKKHSPLWHFHYLVLLYWRILYNIYSLLGNMTSECLLHFPRFLKMSLLFKAHPERLWLMPLYRKRGFFQRRSKVVLSAHLILEAKPIPPVSFNIDFFNMPTHSFPHSHHDILDAFLEAAWQPRTNACHHHPLKQKKWTKRYHDCEQNGVLMISQG